MVEQDTTEHWDQKKNKYRGAVDRYLVVQVERTQNRANDF